MRPKGHGSGLDPGNLWLRYERYPYLLTKILTFGLVAIAIYAVLSTIQDVLTPVLIALFVAYLLDPAVDWFEARGFSRTSGILLFLVVGGGCVLLILLFLYPTLSHIVARISDGVPILLDLLQSRTLPWLEREVVPWAGTLLGMEMPSIEGLFDEFADVLRGQLPKIAQSATRAFGDLWSRVGTIANLLLNLVLVPVLTFYFLRDFDKMRLATVDYLPEHNREWLLQRIVSMDEVMGAWLRGQIQVALLLSSMYAFGLGVTFGFSGIGLTSGVAIGVLAGLLNIVPYFGFLIGILLSVLLALLDWTGWGPLVGVAVTFAVVQALEGYVVTPRIVGEKVGLPPVVVIVALLLGGSLLGLLGVLLALPLAGIARVLLPDAIEWYKASDLYHGRVPGLQPAAAPETAATAAAEPEPQPVVVATAPEHPEVPAAEALPAEGPPVEPPPIEPPPAAPPLAEVEPPAPEPEPAATEPRRPSEEGG